VNTGKPINVFCHPKIEKKKILEMGKSVESVKKT
jgi:hypothetical protein